MACRSEVVAASKTNDDKTTEARGDELAPTRNPL